MSRRYSWPINVLIYDRMSDECQMSVVAALKNGNVAEPQLAGNKEPRAREKNKE